MKFNIAALTLILFIVSIAFSACTSAPTTTITEVPAGSVANPPPASSNTEAEVKISGFAFNPTPLEIKAGTTVTWKNEDSASHTVVADDGSFSSNTINQGESFSFTFDKAGSFPYHCGIHTSMKGTITVTQ
jgi:plastocyanin